MIKITLLY